jgi:hypothetical protein
MSGSYTYKPVRSYLITNVMMWSIWLIVAWLIMLPSIRTFTEDIRELHEQYKRTLESLRAA